MADPVLNVSDALSIAEVLTIIGGGATLVWRISKMATKFELIGKQQAAEIKELKNEAHELRMDVEKLNDIMIELTRTSGRMDRIEDRQIAQGKRLDESVQRFNDWTDRVYEERHRQLIGRISKLENGH